MTATFSRKIAAALMGIAIAAGALGTAGRANAAGLTPAEAALLAGFGGLVVGGMIAEHSHHKHHKVVVDSWEMHVARCEAKYNSYDEEYDAFLGYDGEWHRCRL